MVLCLHSKYTLVWCSCCLVTVSRELQHLQMSAHNYTVEATLKFLFRLCSTLRLLWFCWTQAKQSFGACAIKLAMCWLHKPLIGFVVIKAIATCTCCNVLYLFDTLQKNNCEARGHFFWRLKSYVEVLVSHIQRVASTLDYRPLNVSSGLESRLYNYGLTSI